MPSSPLPDAVPPSFDYFDAFSRNIGWLTEWEQASLRYKTVAIAGVGGVGGSHAHLLARLGVGGLHISDPDSFELANFNRQAGARLSTIGKLKSEVIAADVLNINPELRIKDFPGGITEENIDEFLDGVDLFVDGLDFFVLDIRRKIFARARELGIPAITAAPLGMGVAYLVITADGMSFEDYFRFDDAEGDARFVNFVLGLSPKRYQMQYLVDATRADFKNRRAPSTPVGISLCAGIVGTEAVRLLLGRGQVRGLPWVHHFDPYVRRYSSQRLWRGNRNPLQRLKLKIAYQLFARLSDGPAPTPLSESKSEMEQILDLARWTPSGDNTQPWSFHIRTPDDVDVEIIHPASEDVYDFDNRRPTFLSAGMLLESMSIAASRFGRRLEWAYQSEDDQRHLIKVRMPKADVATDSLLTYLPMRSVRRGSLSRTAISKEAKAGLADALGNDFEVLWHESAGERWQMSRVNALATHIRLSIPEAYEVHRRIIDWDRRYSPDRVPATAVGLNPVALRMMKWAMTSWPRMNILNRYLGGTILARLEMDLLPGMACGAHFTIVAKEADWWQNGPEQVIRSGCKIQRFWLEATRLGLGLQPAIAPIIFGFYGRYNPGFTKSQGIQKAATRLAQRLLSASSVEMEQIVFRGRLGELHPTLPEARSIRKPLADLSRSGQ